MSFNKKRSQRINKERSQPGHRANLGPLEKHKDYVKRARDYNAKRDELKALQEKAAMRNPDEFYFHMESSRMQEGKHIELKEKTLPLHQQKMLTEQDGKYLRLQVQKERHAIEKAQGELQFVGVEKPKSHIVFVDSVDDARNFDVAEYFDTAPELVGRFHNRPRKAQLEEPLFVEGDDNSDDGGVDNDVDEGGDVVAKKSKKNKKKRPHSDQYRDLEARIKRKAVLDEMLDRVELKKKLMAPGDKKLIRDKRSGKSHYVWASERKKWFVFGVFSFLLFIQKPR